MFPAYSVKPDDILEVLFAVSELDSTECVKDISKFSGLSERKCRESIKILEELDITLGDENSCINDPYEDLLERHPTTEWDTVLNKALLNYQPFIDFVTYMNKGYSNEQAAQKVYAYDQELASKSKYIQEYFESLGQHAGILTESGEVTIDSEEIPESEGSYIKDLREALQSELEIRVYLGDLLGQELIQFLDEDTIDDLVKAYLEYSTDPRDSISAAGRAFEDFLRNLGETYGNDERDYSTGLGIVPLCNHLQGDDLVKKHHKRRVMALAEIRNKGGAHGDDAEILDRWQVTPIASLNCVLSTVLLIKSIYRYATKTDLTL